MSAQGIAKAKAIREGKPPPRHIEECFRKKPLKIKLTGKAAPVKGKEVRHAWTSEL